MIYALNSFATLLYYFYEEVCLYAFSQAGQA